MLKVIQKKKCRKGVNFKKDSSSGAKITKALPIVFGITIFGSLSIAGSTYAETATATYNLTTNVSAENELTLSLDTTSGVINLAPGYDEDSAATSSASTVATIRTRNGYQLFMTGSPNLTDTNTNESIPALSCSNADGCTLSNNSWGYNIGKDVGSTFKSLADGSSKISSGTEDATVRVNFGVKVDYNTKPGSYTNTINFIALTDPTKVYMQFMQDSDCTTTRQQVWDSRDGTSYYVKRLEDGNCWMLDNLALDPTADNGNGGTIMDNMTALNTNASAQALAILKGGADAAGIDNTSKKYASSGITSTWKENFITGVWANNKTTWTDHRLDSDWGDKKDNYTDNWTVPRVNASRMNDIPDTTYGTDGDNKIGVYYNYCSASAGTYCYDGPVYSAADSSQNKDSTMTGSPNVNAAEDICPAGWSLPTGGGSGEFQALYGKYDATAVEVDGVSVNGYNFRQALSTPLSGNVNHSSGAVVNVGAFGYWWSSTRYNTNSMYDLHMGASSVDPAHNGYRSYGFSIRCVLR